VMTTPADLSNEIKKHAALALFGAIVCLLASAGQVSAQAIDIPAIMNPDLNAPPTIATFQYGHQFKTDVDDNSEMSRNNAFLSLSQRIKVADKTSVFLLGSYTLQAYNFNDDPSGGSTTQKHYQWDDVHRGVIAALVGHDVNDRWRLIGGALVRSWGESGANFGDTITGGVIAGFDYHPNEDFSIGLILGAFSALEDHVGILPVPTLKWQFAENWKWTVGLTTVLDPGVGSELEFTINDEFSIGAGFTYQTRRVRLRDGNRAGDGAGRTDKGGVGQETELPVFVQIRWRPIPAAAIDLLGGVALAGHLRVEDNDGNHIADDDYDAAPFVGLKGQIFF
jgi:hypothetical protein